MLYCSLTYDFFYYFIPRFNLPSSLFCYLFYLRCLYSSLYFSHKRLPFIDVYSFIFKLLCKCQFVVFVCVLSAIVFVYTLKLIDLCILWISILYLYFNGSLLCTLLCLLVRMLFLRLFVLVSTLSSLNDALLKFSSNSFSISVSNSI